MANKRKTSPRTKRPAPDTTPRVDPDDVILTTREVLACIPVDRSTLWAMCRQGRFPRPIQLTRSRIGWRQSKVRAWIKERETDPIVARDYFNYRADQS